MANVLFKKGLLANLPKTYAAGTFYVTTDERAMYLDVDDSTRIRLGDFIQVDTIADLPSEGASTTALYYVVDSNILAKWNGEDWTQINKQPSIDDLKLQLGIVDKEGNQLFDAAGSAAAAEAKVLEYVGTIPNGTDGNPIAESVVAYINKKTDGIATSGNLEALAERVGANEQAIGAINHETNGILAQAKAYVNEEDVFETEMNTINALGGIGADVNLNGLTTHEVLKKLLYPYVDASVGNASASPNGGTYEKGETKTITQVSIAVTKKSEPITSVALYDGSGKQLDEKTGDAVKNGGTITFTGLSIPVSANGGKLTVKVTYPDANGNAKTVSKETGAFTFISPYFYGVCGAAAEINADLVLGLTKDLTSKGTKTYSYTTNAQRMVIAYPSSYGKIKLVKDGNGLDNTGAFGNPTTVSVTSDLGVTEEYYVYANGVTSGSAKMTFSY